MVAPLDRSSDGSSATVTNGKWQFRSYVGGDSGHCSPTSVLNPNKSVLTVDSSGGILTANDVTSLTLGYSEEIICEMNLADFILNGDALDTILATLSHARSRSPRKVSPPSGAAATDGFLPSQVEDLMDGEDDTVVFSGKVISVLTKESLDLPVSIWMKKLPLEEEVDPRWLVVLEPVHMIVSTVFVDLDGLIKKCDVEFLRLFEEKEEGSETLEGRPLQFYIPSFTAPKEHAKKLFREDCTGKSTESSSAFPLAVNQTRINDTLYEIKIRVCLNLSGLVVLDSSGVIMDYNRNFVKLLFGYDSTDLLSKNMAELIPCFSQRVPHPEEEEGIEPILPEEGDVKLSLEENSQTIPYLDDSLKENVGHSSSINQLSRINSDNVSWSPNKAFLASESQFISSNSSCFLQSKSFGQKSATTENLTSADAKSFNEDETTTTTTPKDHTAGSQVMKDITNSVKSFTLGDQTVDSGDSSAIPPNHSLITSTPAVKKAKPPLASPAPLEDGNFCGIALHKNGSKIVVTYLVKRVVIKGVPQFCVWVLWEPESRDMTILFSDSLSSQNRSRKLTMASLDEDSDTDSDESTSSSTRTDASSEGEYSLHHSKVVLDDQKIHLLKDRKDVSQNWVDEDEGVLVAGDYDDRYSILRQIGKGTFGCAKLSFRNKDGLMVITKFIKKDKVYKESWEEDPKTLGRIPLEISLLLSLSHPNIVSALEYFENDDYFQLIMEKWGAAMDLFEFIDRNPALDEPLASYIFRQIVSAIVYLRTKGILHRDIKDENVIIDQNFHIKLIDFGSAAYLKSGHVFSQFVGTVEYCSPEVLKGYKYTGPEVEIWSLGITLYTLIYGENPFYDIDEILNHSLQVLETYSEDLNDLLQKMLEKNPLKRLALEDVALHPWTDQDVQLDLYHFGDIVNCSPEELNPKTLISDYSQSEVSLSTTSSSFVYEGNRSSFTLDPRGGTSFSEGDSYRKANRSVTSPTGNVSPISNRQRQSCTSEYAERTRSSTTQSIRSFVTIDSSLLTASSVSKDDVARLEDVESSLDATADESASSSSASFFSDSVSVSDLRSYISPTGSPRSSSSPSRSLSSSPSPSPSDDETLSSSISSSSYFSSVPSPDIYLR